MKIVDMKGIILSEVNYSDSSKILNVLTEEYGLISILSKGCRNLKSKLRGTSRKLLYGTFHFYYRENGVSTISSIDVINAYPKIMTDLASLCYASFILDLTYQVVRQSEAKEIMSLLINALDKIEQGLNKETITNIIQLKYLTYLGVEPILDGCVSCGDKTNIVGLDATLGGFVCANCYQNRGYNSSKAIKLIRMYSLLDISKITKIEVADETNLEIYKFLEEYYDRYTGIYLKSRKMLNKTLSLLKE